MSVVPLMFRDWWDDFDRPTSRLIDQHFGSAISRDDLFSGLSSWNINRPRSIFPTSMYYRPWRTLARSNSGGASTIQCDKDKFEVRIYEWDSDEYSRQIYSTIFFFFLRILPNFYEPLA